MAHGCSGPIPSLIFRGSIRSRWFNPRRISTSPPASFSGRSVRWGRQVWIFGQLIFGRGRHTDGADNAVIVMGPSSVSILNSTSSANIGLVIPATPEILKVSGLPLIYSRWVKLLWPRVVLLPSLNSRVASVSILVSFCTLTAIVPRAVLDRCRAANWPAMMVMSRCSSCSNWWWLQLQLSIPHISAFR